MRLRVFCLCVASLAVVRGAETPVENGDFSQRPAGEARLASFWTMPDGGAWASVNTDGLSGQDSMRYSSRVQRKSGPVAQEVVLPAGTEFLLSAALKSDGRLRPRVSVRTAAVPGGEPKVLANADWTGKAHAWQRVSTRFTGGAAQRVVVELWADRAHAGGSPARAGTATFDDVRITLAATAGAMGGHSVEQVYTNVALGRPYTLSPRPNYTLCTEVGDKTQLTDGVYTEGYFWTQLSTVGWSRCRPIVISLDLGRDRPIRGMSYNAAAGVAGVCWVNSIVMLASVDGRTFHDVGDLVALSRQRKAPPEGKYAVHRFATDGLQTHARYLKLLIDPAGPFCFVDEIEVFAGDEAWLDAPLPGEEIRYPLEYFSDNQFNAAIKRRLGTDLESVRSTILDAGLAGQERARLMREVKRLEEAIGQVRPLKPEGFRTVFPLNDVHAAIYALNGALLQARGRSGLVPWGANRWDFFTPHELPAAPPPPEVFVAAMVGEVRAGALNVTNCTTEPCMGELRFDGLPGRATPGYITVCEVPWTDTQQGKIVAAALPEAEKTRGGYRISFPAGMTRQIWFSVEPRGIPAGTHRGYVVITGAQRGPLRVPFVLRVFDVTFPEQPTLHVGGWDYTNVDRMYGVTDGNREALIAHLRERYVDSPWATRGVMPYGKYDKGGNLIQTPDTAPFDTWLERWPEARCYCVFNAVSGEMAGVKIGDALFEKQVGTWIRFWVDHARGRGLQPPQLKLLLVDEPHGEAKDRTIIAWAKAIKAAEPDVVIWEDPTYRQPEEAVPEMMQVVDVLCPNRPMMLAQGSEFVAFYRQQKADGRRLDLYSCSGPARLLDPYAYHRLQAWSCFDLGAESTFFWAFADTGKGDSWNEYTMTRTAFTPLFVSPDSVTAGKHMEAIRESVGDFEYLTMLKQRLAARQEGATDAITVKARQVLAGAVRRVLDSASIEGIQWLEPKDRSVADKVRIEIGELLEKLK